MELLELTNKTLDIFCTENIEDLKDSILDVAIKNKTESMEKFESMVDCDLTQDWLQKVYQYHLADRKNKKQDDTPKTVAKLMSKLALSKDKHIIDMCAGSGALTIQAWALDNDITAECLEFDENVLPILIFNLAIRNIKSVVKHVDVLENDVLSVYKISKTEKYGKVEKIS